MGEIEVSHFLCRKHSERTLDQKLAGPKCKKAKKHLYDALYYRKTGPGCEDSIKKAIDAAPKDKRNYIEQEWYQTRAQWANYACQHSCLLLQCMTTNAVKSWHASIKKHADGIELYSFANGLIILIYLIGKASFMTFSLIGTANHVLHISDQWENWANKQEALFRTTVTPECKDYPALKRFLYPVQKLIIEQYKEAVKSIENGDKPAGEMPDELICLISCLFYWQYQLPCKYLWHYNILFDSFQESDWIWWAELFEDRGFEIYETVAKIQIDTEQDIIKGPDRHMLEVQEVLDHIKDKYYEIPEQTAQWTAEERDPIIEWWISWLEKLTGPIQKQGAEQALRELEAEAEKDEAEGRPLTQKKQRRVLDDSKEEE